MKVLIDTNILIDYFAKRTVYYEFGLDINPSYGVCYNGGIEMKKV